MISLITGVQVAFSLTSVSSCNCATFVPKITDASELLRLFQCADVSSNCDQCLASTEFGFEFETCDVSFPAQLLDGNQAGIQSNHKKVWIHNHSRSD